MATTHDHCLWNSSQEKMEGRTLVCRSRADTRTRTRRLQKVWEIKGVLSWMKEDDDNAYGCAWRLTQLQVVRRSDSFDPYSQTLKEELAVRLHIF